MPRERPQPEPFEPAALERSLDRYLIAGLIFMALLISGFVAYRAREPGLRTDAAQAQKVTYTSLGRSLFSNNCAQCHGDKGEGGGSAASGRGRSDAGGPGSRVSPCPPEHRAPGRSRSVAATS